MYVGNQYEKHLDFDLDIKLLDHTPNPVQSHQYFSEIMELI